jgi:hypothetical protein
MTTEIKTGTTAELQKQTSEALTFGNLPKEFVTNLSELLTTLQDAYRSRLADSEHQLWITTLSYAEEKFSMQEVHAAITNMIKNPPLYEVDGPDGPITQKWRGMPKITDVIETMLALRAARSREAVKAREERQRLEQMELAKRRQEHPEEFMGPELLKSIKESLPVATENATDKNGLTMPGNLCNAARARNRLPCSCKRCACAQTPCADETAVGRIS